MDQNDRGDDKMFRKINYSTSYRNPKSGNQNKVNNLIDTKKHEITEKQLKYYPKFESEKKMTDADFFLTLLLKNLSSDERFLLLNKLLTLNWDEADEDLSNYLTELINKKKTDAELKESLDYEYFLLDFNNWKNYFLSQTKK